MKKQVLKIARKVPFIRVKLERYRKLIKKESELQKVSAELKELKKLAPLWIEAGHFYSPITSSTEFKRFDSRETVPGIDLHKKEQLELLKQLAKYYKDVPFKKEAKKGYRYYYNNDQFSYGDAITLYTMLRHLNPARVIEVGSGYSSAIMLDVRDQVKSNSQLTFIEPYPTRLKSLLHKDDASSLIIEEKVQDVDLAVFDKLAKGDILFIDSSHVSKSGSDVNWLFFEVLPRLKKGVHIHVHDILYPFEYPNTWIEQGRSWNEAYIVRALLQDSKSYKISFWGNFLFKFNKDKFKSMPDFKKNPGGSIWFVKQ